MTWYVRTPGCRALNLGQSLHSIFTVYRQGSYGSYSQKIYVIHLGWLLTLEVDI